MTMMSTAVRSAKAAGSLSRPAHRSARLVIRAEYSSSSGVGSKVERWMKTPFDILAFGPRVGAGLLLSVPEKLQTLQGDVEKAIELLQDPRPLEEKQSVVFQEVEDQLVSFLEKGATVESDILANVKTVLPAEAVSVLTELIPEPPNKQPSVVPVEAYTVEPSQPAVTYYQGDVASAQVASEMTEIKNAVSGLKSALDAVRVNIDAANTGILRLNLKEARDQLARRLAEVSPATSSDPTISAATREARILLEEVDAQFFA